MKKLEEIKISEIEALSDFQEHIGSVLYYMDIISNSIDGSKRRKMEKCYKYLDYLWESIEEIINKLCDADARHK